MVLTIHVSAMQREEFTKLHCSAVETLCLMQDLLLPLFTPNYMQGSDAHLTCCGLLKIGQEGIEASSKALDQHCIL